MGSRLGWILSGALVLGLVLFVVIMLVRGGDPTPTTLAITTPGFFEVHEPNTRDVPKFLGGPLPSGPGNAGDDYRRAVDIYRAHHDEVGDADDLRKSAIRGKSKFTPPQATLSVLEDIYTHVAAGATKKEMRYSTPADISVRLAYEPAYRLSLVGDAVVILGDAYEADKKHEDAEKAFRAAFLLGYHMTKEHVQPLLFKAGLEVQASALGHLGTFYANWDKKKYQDVLDALEDYIKDLQKVYHEDCEYKLGAIIMATPHPGDVFAVVERDQDRAWRVEALLLCGVIRFTHPTHAGNQRVVQKLIEENANSPDPFVKAAAVAARDLTAEGFKQTGAAPTP